MVFFRFRSGFFFSIDFTVRLNILSNLNTELKVARQGRFLKRYEWYPSTHQESISNSRKGRARLESERWEDYTLEWITNYYTTIQDVHNIKLMGGYSYQEFNWEKYGAENMDFPSDALKYNNLGTGQWNTKEGRLGMWSEKEKEKNIAFLGRLNYDYKDVLLLMASLRYEGSSKFGKDHKWGLFPALSAAWRLSSLPIFQQTEIVARQASQNDMITYNYRSWVILSIVTLVLIIYIIWIFQTFTGTENGSSLTF